MRRATTTFVHAADLHLDAPFKGVDARDPRVRDVLVESTYRALDRVVSACVEREADFLIIAGDVYNHRDKSLRAQLRFRDAMQRLADARIPVYIAQGNHDPADGWSAGIEMPSNVHYFATDRVERVEVVHAGMPVCAVYGRGYATSAVTANLARGFERDPADAVAVGVLHANVGGQPGFEPYAPCTLDDLRAARMDYWALGHIHAPRLLASDPHVRYAGCTQGLDPSEGGAHGCWFVTVSEGAVAEEFVPTDELRWAGLSVDVSGVEDIDALRTTLDAACDAERTRAEGRPVIVRIDLIGRAAVHALLARPGVLADLTGDVRERQLVEEPWVWIDRVRDLTRPEIDLDALRGSSDFLGDLVAIADDMTRDPDAVSAFVGDALEPLRGVPGAVPVDASEAADLVERARDLCLDRLLAGEER